MRRACASGSGGAARGADKHLAISSEPSHQPAASSAALFASPSPNGESKKAWKVEGKYMISEREFNHDGDEDFTGNSTASADQDHITLFTYPEKDKSTTRKP